jgi:hypothetical protein
MRVSMEVYGPNRLTALLQITSSRCFIGVHIALVVLVVLVTVGTIGGVVYVILPPPSHGTFFFVPVAWVRPMP